MASEHDESRSLQHFCSVKYLLPFAYGHDPSAPTRRMSTLRDQTLASTRVHPYSQRRPVPAASPSLNPIPSPIYGGPPQASVGNRLVLPSLASTFTNAHSDQHDMLSSRSQAMRSGEGFSHSFPVGGVWDNNAHSPMADHPYNYTNSHLDAFDPRQHHTPTPPQGQGHGLRRSPNSLTESHRRPSVPHPQISIATTGLGLTSPPRDESSTNNWTGVNYYSSSYPANFALASGPPDVGIHSPTSYPAPNYGMASFHTGPHHSSTYPTAHTHAAIDPRQPPHHAHSSYQPGTHPSMSSHRPSHASTGPWDAQQRENQHAARNTEAHLVSPYSRTAHQAKETSTSPQEASPVEFPSVKKKRRRADANQLKVLNDVYARTAFPTTDERLELARKLDMSARSVQIWFQNKRQSSRSRNVSNAANPSMLHHPYLGGAGPSSVALVNPGPSHMPMSMPVPSHPHAHGLSRPGAEVSVSPSAVHGGSYTVHPHPSSGSYPSTFSGTHRPASYSYRAQSPSHMGSITPEGALRRARSPEGSSRMRAQTPAGRP